jgi:isocitrate dehydrogenase
MANRITVIMGDGIGPEVVKAAQRIIDATGAKIEWDEQQAGAAVFKRGILSGVPLETIDSIQHNRVVLKGPLATPVGYGEKSANVTLRKLFETYGNIRPVREIPGVITPFSGRGIDLVVVRENVEDLYAGIEHRQTPGVAQCLKLISRKGCEKVARLAFEFARATGRKKIHCATKANIMKLTEGLMKQTFEDVASDYPDIEADHIIVDNCAHQLVIRPEQFDIILTTNMNGDILSDLTSGLVGGLGFAPSANIGNQVAIFEAVHGSAPKYAGKNIINPTALIFSAVMLLRHIGEFAAATLIENSVLYTLETQQAQTFDIPRAVNVVSTSEYADTVIANLGKSPVGSTSRDYRTIKLPELTNHSAPVTSRRTVGLDIFVESDLSPVALGESLNRIAQDSPLRLKMVSNRGTKVYPPVGAMIDNVDHWRCRFVLRDAQQDLTDHTAVSLLQKVASQYHWMHIEKLTEFDSVAGFTRAQGED